MHHQAIGKGADNFLAATRSFDGKIQFHLCILLCYFIKKQQSEHVYISDDQLS